MAEVNYMPDPNLKIWLNGKLVPTADANINVFSHALLYGDGVFEGIRIYNGRVFECTAHMERFFDSLKAIRLDIPYTREQIVDATLETAKANNLTDGYVRLVAGRGVGTLGIHPQRVGKADVFIIVGKIQMYDPSMYETGMKIVTSSVIRNHPNALSPRIKSLNYLNNILAKWDAIDNNVLEAVMLNHEGYVSECTGDNLFIVQRGVVRTPAAHCGILEGVTRRLILHFARKRGLPTEECILTRPDLYFAEEAFITGTGAEVCPVNEIDKRMIGDGKPGPITKALIADFRAHTRSKDEILVGENR